MMRGKERELWFEDGRWFVAAKVAASQTPRLTHKEPDTLYLLPPLYHQIQRYFYCQKRSYCNV